MKNSISEGDAKRLATALDSLCVINPEKLAEQWHSLFGSDPNEPELASHALAPQTMLRADALFRS